MRKKNSSQVDLAKVFSAVTEVLKENQQSLNEADEYNHNHGDNMVENFQEITRAVRAKRRTKPAEQLAAARERLSQRAQSGSARVYVEGLGTAAERLKDEPAITQEDALLLVQALMGGQTAAPQQPAQQQDLLGGLLGAFLGGAPAQTQPSQPAAEHEAGGINMDMLVAAGSAFLQARQRGAEPTDALVQAVMAGSQMQSSAHRSQSGQLVAQTLINTLGSMLARKK